MRSLKRFGFGSLCFSLLCVALASPAAADSVQIQDPLGDAPAHFDIEWVGYRNAPQKVTTHIVVPGLIRSGKARLQIQSYPTTDFIYFAKVRVLPDGTLGKHLIFRSLDGSQRVDCGFTAVWNARENFIDISVPRPCFSMVDTELIHLQSVTGFMKDYADPAQHLKRG